MKRSSFLGSPLGQSMLISPFLAELVSAVHRFTQVRVMDAGIQRSVLYLLNAITVLAFSGKRKMLLPSSFFTDAISAISTVVVPAELLELPFSPLHCLQLLLSPNR